VASLGLVSPGAATEGVTPMFPEKNDDLFSHHRSPVPPLFIFSRNNWRPYFAHHCNFYRFHSDVTPIQGVTPHLFYLTDLVCPLFFVNLPTNCFRSGVTPWRVSPRAVRPSPLVTPLISGHMDIFRNLFAGPEKLTDGGDTIDLDRDGPPNTNRVWVGTQCIQFTNYHSTESSVRAGLTIVPVVPREGPRRPPPINCQIFPMLFDVWTFSVGLNVTTTKKVVNFWEEKCTPEESWLCVWEKGPALRWYIWGPRMVNPVMSSVLKTIRRELPPTRTEPDNRISHTTSTLYHFISVVIFSSKLSFYKNVDGNKLIYFL